MTATAAVVRLDVPYISQLVGGSGGNNCGPACLAMALAFRGVIPPTQAAMLEVADIARDGLSNDVGETGGYVTFAQLTMVANWYGQSTAWYSTWEQIDGAIEAQEPVIILLDNTVLQPRQYPVDPAWNATHFILLTGVDYPSNQRPSSDPLSYYVGGPWYYTEASTQQGVRNVGGVQAISLTPLEQPPVPGPEPPLPPEVYDMLTGAQQAAVQAALWGDYWGQTDPDFAIPSAWRDEWRSGRYRGRPVSAEQPIPASEDRPDGTFQVFELGVCCWLRDVGTSWNG